MSTGGASSAETDVAGADWRFIAFSSTNFGKALLWTTADIFCLVFATDTLGVDPALAGTIILAVLLWDALSDPVCGLLVDRYPCLSRSYGRTIVMAAPVSAFFLVLAFASQFVTGAAGVVLFTSTLLLFRTAFTFVDIPDNALFSRVARNARSRIVGATARKLAATAAAVLVSLGTSWVFSEAGRFTEGIRMLLVACAVGPLAGLALAAGVRLVAARDRDDRPAMEPAWPSLPALLANRMVLGLATHMFCASLSIAIFMASLVYHARFVIGDARWFSAGMSIFLVAQAAGVVVWGWHAARRTAATALSRAGALAVIAVLLFLAASSPVTMTLACGLFGFCAGGLNSLRWALAPAAAEVAQRTIRQKNEAAVMALFSLSIKSAIGIASLAVGMALSISGYTAGATATAGQAAVFSSLTAGLSILSMIPAILSHCTRLPKP